MKQKLCIIMLFVIFLCGCSKEQPTAIKLDDLSSCNHTEKYHFVPAVLIRSVGYQKYENTFHTPYFGSEQFNIVNFLKQFDITRERFEEAIINNNLELAPGVPYDLDIIYSNDQAKIDEYFKK